MAGKTEVKSEGGGGSADWGSRDAARAPEEKEEGKQETDEDEELYGGVAIKLSSAEAPPAASGAPVRRALRRSVLCRVGWPRTNGPMLRRRSPPTATTMTTRKTTRTTMRT